jgi:hypothetical protein
MCRTPHLYKGGLLLLRALGRVGQQERTLHAGAGTPHRIEVIKIAFDEFNMWKRARLRFAPIASHSADLYALSRQSLDDFAAYRPSCSGN